MIVFAQRRLQGHLDSNRGFTLIEVLLAIGLLVGVVFAFIASFNVLNNSLSNIFDTDEISDSVINVRNAIGLDDRYCKQVLAGKNLAMSNLSGSSIDKIDYWNLETGTPFVISNVVTLGAPIGKKIFPIVQDLRIKPVTELSVIYSRAGVVVGKNMLSNLELTYSKNDLMSAKQTIRSIPIYAVTDATNAIVSCSASTTASTQVKDKICMLSNFGYARYDAISDDCYDSPDVAWVSGASPETAACPPGMRVAASVRASPAAAASSVCKVENGTQVDIPARTYNNGFTDSGPSEVSKKTVDLLNSVCHFNYLAGADLTAAIAKIKCVHN